MWCLSWERGHLARSGPKARDCSSGQDARAPRDAACKTWLNRPRTLCVAPFVKIARVQGVQPAWAKLPSRAADSKNLGQLSGGESTDSGAGDRRSGLDRFILLNCTNISFSTQLAGRRAHNASTDSHGWIEDVSERNSGEFIDIILFVPELQTFSICKGLKYGYDLFPSAANHGRRSRDRTRAGSGVAMGSVCARWLEAVGFVRTEAPKRRSAEAPKRRSAEAPKRRSAEAPKRRSAEAPKRRSHDCASGAAASRLAIADLPSPTDRRPPRRGGRRLSFHLCRIRPRRRRACRPGRGPARRRGGPRPDRDHPGLVHDDAGGELRRHIRVYRRLRFARRRRFRVRVPRQDVHGEQPQTDRVQCDTHSRHDRTSGNGHADAGAGRAGVPDSRRGQGAAHVNGVGPPRPP